jgi:hypothetical protein
MIVTVSPISSASAVSVDAILAILNFQLMISINVNPANGSRIWSAHGETF